MSMQSLESQMSEEGQRAPSSEIAGERLLQFIERIERMEEEKKALMDDIKEIYAEAKGTGFDVKVLRQVVRIRKMDSGDRAEQEALLDLYLSAVGIVRG